jgi:3-oxoacyl-[acyl-carrier protein] reductase
MSLLRDTCLQAGSVIRGAISANRGARLVFLVRTPSVRAVPGASIAGVAGAFMSTMAQVTGIELAGQDITCNVVVAGWTEDDSPASMVDGIPAGRFLEYHELAGTVEFLVSPIASYINGAALVVDGGFSVSKVGGGSPLLT